MRSPAGAKANVGMIFYPAVVTSMPSISGFVNNFYPSSISQVRAFADKGGSELPSPYVRIGGAPAVDAAVEIFYKKILADETIAYMFENTNMKRQKVHQKKFLTQALGGPKE